MLALGPWVGGVELDVRVTADGVPVVIHDRRVDRTTDGEGSVGEHSLEQLQALDAGLGQRVPTLAAFLESCEDRDWRRILVDMKDVTDDAFTATAEVLDASPLADRCLVMIRPWDEQAERFRSINSRLRLGSFRVTVDNIDDVLLAMARLGGELVLTDPHAYLRHRAIVPQAQAAGLQAGSSTNNARASLLAAARDGCDVILSDVTHDLRAL